MNTPSTNIDWSLWNDEDFCTGVALFNHAEFWHAHEAWERLWLVSSGPQRLFVQGLIQTAAALVHWQRGNQRGLQLNWRKAQPKLSQSLALNHDLNLADVMRQMENLASDPHQLAPQLSRCDASSPIHKEVNP